MHGFSLGRTRGNICNSQHMVLASELRNVAKKQDYPLADVTGFSFMGIEEVVVDKAEHEAQHVSALEVAASQSMAQRQGAKVGVTAMDNCQNCVYVSAVGRAVA